MILVVSDTSAIRALAHLNCLALLPALFDKVVVPPSVRAELVHPPPAFPSVDVANIDFIDVQEPSDAALVTLLEEALDRAEAEAIVLAEELHARWLLIDEKAGRAVARQRGLTVVGTLGVLLRMKDKNRIDRIAPLLDRLQSELGFFLSDSLRQEILNLVGEANP